MEKKPYLPKRYLHDSYNQTFNGAVCKILLNIETVLYLLFVFIITSSISQNGFDTFQFIP